jgi:hypothetical protein
MFSFLERTAAASDIAETLFEKIRKDAETGEIDRPFLRGAPPADVARIKEEWLYFDVFSIDLFVFIAFGRTPEKKAILDPFYLLIRRWLGDSRVPALPERAGLYGLELKTVAGENSEPTLDRLNRRSGLYAEVIREPPPLGEAWGLARIFGILCRSLDGLDMMEFSALFSNRKLALVKLLKAKRITFP